MVVCLFAGVVAKGGAAPSPPAGGGPDDLVTLFKDFRVLPEAEGRRRRPGLLGVGDGGAGRADSRVSQAARGDRRERLADPAAGGLAHGPRRAERARLRPPRAQALGEQPGLLRHGVRRGERSAGARRAVRDGAVELWSYTFPLSARRRGEGRRRPPRDSRRCSRRRRRI